MQDQNISKRAWTAESIGDLGGRAAVVTGANSGIGLETARALGAHVVLACRDERKGLDAALRVAGAVSGADVESQALDLADLTSVRQFVAGYQEHHDRLDILINNAGVMGGPYRRTVDGSELQFATNHIGHFALTGVLIPALTATPGARVVTVTSSAAAMARLDLDDMNGERRYSPVAAYSRSKLANLMFTLELDRRAKAANVDLVSVASHPGVAASNITAKHADRGRNRRPGEALVALTQRILGQPSDKGAPSSLYAASAAGVRGGELVGPRRGGMRGTPTAQKPSARATDDQTARRLWEISTDLTHVSFEALTHNNAPSEADHARVKAFGGKLRTDVSRDPQASDQAQH
jgi:NAD(P)-dependent dehydrogenase (short-subunit alcohol dehydrogenase family)